MVVAKHTLGARPVALRVVRSPVDGVDGGPAIVSLEVDAQLLRLIDGGSDGEELIEVGVGVCLVVVAVEQLKPYVVVALPVGLHLHPEMRRVALLVLGEVEREVVVIGRTYSYYRSVALISFIAIMVVLLSQPNLYFTY